MKFLFSFLSLLMLNKECDYEKKSYPVASINKTTQVQPVNSKIVQDSLMTISYTAQTRGTYKSITVSQQQVTVNNSRAKNPKMTFPCSKDDWNEITRLLSNIDTSKLKDLKVPSTKSHYDGALGATLKLIVEGKEMSSPTFDHGNPPSEVVQLVNKLLSMGKMEQK